MADLRDALPAPLVLAPMAGGPSTPELVVAGARAGILGFLGAGYKTGAQVRQEIEAVRAATSAPFGVNVFVPGEPAPDAAAVGGYVDRLRNEGFTVGSPTW